MKGNKSDTVLVQLLEKLFEQNNEIATWQGLFRCGRNRTHVERRPALARALKSREIFPT